MEEAAAARSWTPSWILRWMLVTSIVFVAACSGVNLDDFAASDDNASPFEPSETNAPTRTSPPVTSPTTTAAPPPTTTPPPPPTPPPPLPSPAELIGKEIDGNQVLLTWTEPGRPLLGWRDTVNIWYCSDGTMAYESNGRRTTVLGNTEFRSLSERGTWRVTGTDNIVGIDHLNDFGVFFTFWIEVGPTGLTYQDGWSVQVQGSVEGC